MISNSNLLFFCFTSNLPFNNFAFLNKKYENIFQTTRDNFILLLNITMKKFLIDFNNYNLFTNYYIISLIHKFIILIILKSHRINKYND